MDWRAALIGAAVGLGTEWARRLLWARYRLWLAEKKAAAEQTESTADDEALDDLIEEAKEAKGE